MSHCGKEAMMDALWIVTIVFLPFLAYGVMVEVIRLKRKKTRFEDRDIMSLDAIYSQYFEKEGLKKSDVIYLWEEIAKLLRIEAGRLRPTDRWDNELAPDKNGLVDDELEEVLYYLWEIADECGFEIDIKNQHDLGTMIEYVVERRVGDPW
jgi:hypothetical protein